MESINRTKTVLNIPAQAKPLNFKVLKDYNSVDTIKWEDFVRNHPEGNFFQSPGFYRFISGLQGFSPVVIAAMTDEGAVLGVLVGMIQVENGFLKKKFSSRLIVRGGPLTDEANPELTVRLLEVLIKEYGRKCIYFEFRNLFLLENVRHHFLNSRFRFCDYLDVIIDTDKFRQSVQKMSASKKRQLKKSLENKARIEENPTIEQVKQFYFILKDLYSNKVKKPLPGWSFFEKFYQQPDLGRFFLIEYSGKIIGGCMCPVYDNKIIYEWYIAGEDGKHQGVYPSVLATWAPIDFALKNNLLMFDFLGAGKPDEDYGVREFKTSFGGDLVNFGRYTRINNPLLYFIGKTGLSLLKKLKA